MLSAVASTLLAVANIQLARDFNLTGLYTPSLPVALFVLGLGLGPLFLSPLSEIYGRRIIYLVSYALFTVLNVGCALAPNITALSILRLLSGIAGSSGPALGAGTIGDMFERKEQGGAQAIYGFVSTAGPFLGGIIGGFILSGTGDWPWLMWIMVIAPGLIVAVSVFLLRETYEPFLLHRNAKRLLAETGVPHYEGKERERPMELILQSITRPLRLLCFSPICTVLSVYLALYVFPYSNHGH